MRRTSVVLASVAFLLAVLGCSATPVGMGGRASDAGEASVAEGAFSSPDGGAASNVDSAVVFPPDGGAPVT